MGSKDQNQLHFVLFPMMAQGHMIPMMDIAKILAQQHNVIVTVVTTPKNASRFTSIFARFHINVVQLQFPCKELGLPEGCENLDMLPSLGKSSSFFNASKFLHQQVDKTFEDELITPPPSCIISDICLPYTIRIAKKFNIPRITFVPVSCFYSLCTYNFHDHNVMDSITDESEYFVLPGIPDKIKVTEAQLGLGLKGEEWEEFNKDVLEAELASYGVILNSFEELEPEYAKGYKKVKNDKLWCVGPVSLSNKDHLDMVQRGNIINNKGTSNIDDDDDEWKHIKWLDSQKSGSVIYACLGSLCNITLTQLIELGLAFEASKRPFIWVIREVTHLEALEKWFKENGFEERVSDRGLLIRGWAPQLVILSHPSTGGFLTHCGWNSTLEAICAGVPMLTWPLFSDQFLNQSLIVEILKVGVKVGVKSPMKFGKEDDTGELVKKEDVEKAIEKLMDETSVESEKRRKRIRELAGMAKKAVEIGGSSYSNVTLLIQDIMQKTKDVISSIDVNGNTDSGESKMP